MTAPILKTYRAEHPCAPILASRREAIIRAAMQMQAGTVPDEPKETDNGKP